MVTELLALANIGTGIFKLDAIESIWVRQLDFRQRRWCTGELS